MLNLAVTLVNWLGRIGYERARAASVVTVARVVPAGGIVRDERADGTVLHIIVPAPQARSAGQGIDAEGTAGGEAC
jgi:hypothetical protein